MRYLVGKPRVVHKYNFSDGLSADEAFDIFVDTDFAGCKETRRSTSGGCVMYYGCLVKQWSKTQTTIALSSGEAELHGIASGIASCIACPLPSGPHRLAIIAWSSLAKKSKAP